MKKNKINLKDFRVRSFVTTMDDHGSTNFQGGITGHICPTNLCPTRESECYPNNTET